MSYNNIFLRTNSNVPSLNSNESDLTDTYLSFDGIMEWIQPDLAGPCGPKKNDEGKHSATKSLLLHPLWPISAKSNFYCNPVTVVTNLLSNCQLKLHPH